MKASLFYRGTCVLLLICLVLESVWDAGADEPAPAHPPITLRVTGFRNHKGQLCASLFNSAEGFPTQSDKAFRTFTKTVDADEAKFSFENVPDGAYAVAVLHDENNNGRLDKTLFGYPKEGSGASNNPILRGGPFKFADARFEVTGQRTECQVKLQYNP